MARLTRPGCCVNARSTVTMTARSAGLQTGIARAAGETPGCDGAPWLGPDRERRSAPWRGGLRGVIADHLGVMGAHGVGEFRGRWPRYRSEYRRFWLDGGRIPRDLMARWLGAPVSDRHRPPEAGERVTAARTDGAALSASAIRAGRTYVVAALRAACRSEAPTGRTGGAPSRPRRRAGPHLHSNWRRSKRSPSSVGIAFSQQPGLAPGSPGGGLGARASFTTGC